MEEESSSYTARLIANTLEAYRSSLRQQRAADEENAVGLVEEQATAAQCDDDNDEDDDNDNIAQLISNTLDAYTASLRRQPEIGDEDSGDECDVELVGESCPAGVEYNDSDDGEEDDNDDSDDDLSICADLPDADAAHVVPGTTRLKDALGLLPDRDKAAFLEACRRCPHLVRQESHPQIFLLRHDYNVIEAAQGLVQYWAMRREIFGETRAFLPLNMTGEGALDENDIAALRTGFLVVLPPDKLGRPVLFSDLSRVGAIEDGVFLRTSFFVRCLLCKTNINAVTKGYVGIEMYDGALQRLLERPAAKVLARMLDNGLPTFVKTNYVMKLQKWTFFSLLYSSPSLQDGLLKHSIPVVGSSVGKLQDKLKTLQFDVTSLPNVLGGSWNADNLESWLTSQLQVPPSDSAVAVSPSFSWSNSRRIQSGGAAELPDQKKAEDAIQEMIAAIEFIPAAQKEAYTEAMLKCPVLVRNESNPVHFLRVESNDAVAAAHRLARYWESRKFFFRDRAFRPLTFQKGGVFSDIELSRLDKMTSFRILPNDRYGRPVLWWDASSARKGLTTEEKYKFLMYMLSVVAEQPGAQELGIVFVAIPVIQIGVPLSSKLVKKAIYTCLSIKSSDLRLCFAMETGFTMSFMTMMVNSMMRNPRVHVTQTKKQMCEELVEVGLKREGIPIEFGGLWGPEQELAWRTARDEIEVNRHSAWDFQPITDGPLHRSDKEMHDDTLLETNLKKAMEAALVSMTDSEKASVIAVLEGHPDIFRTECDPSKYVALEGNLSQAARRMALYWKLRAEILGCEEIISSPWRLDNSLANGSIENAGELVRLSHLDYYGRHVFFVENVGDFSSHQWRRVAFMVLAPLCRKDEPNKPDVILIFRTRSGTSLYQNLKIVVDFLSAAFPLVISRVLVGIVRDPKEDEPQQIQSSSPLHIEINRFLSERLAEMTDVYSASTAEELTDILILECGFSRDFFSPWSPQKISQQNTGESMAIHEESGASNKFVSSPEPANNAAVATGVEEVEEMSLALVTDKPGINGADMKAKAPGSSHEEENSLALVTGKLSANEADADGAEAALGENSEEEKSVALLTSMQSTTGDAACMVAAAAAENSEEEENLLVLLADELSKLPASTRRFYDRVEAEASNMIEWESNPRQFLRFERGDPRLAARRLTAYWRQRTQVFQERALQPLTQTGDGALERQDLTNMSAGSVVMLPNDSEGRPVLLYDSSRLKRINLNSETRSMFYWAKLLLENEFTIERGAVMILVCHGKAVTPQANKWFDLCQRCFPFHLHSLYVVCSSSDYSATLRKAIMRFPGMQKTRKEVYTSENALANFQVCGFAIENLPTSIGGSWSYESYAIWQEQRIRQEWGLPLGTVQDESLPYNAKPYSQLTKEERIERKRRFNVLHSRRKRKRDRTEQDQLEAKVKQLEEEKGKLLAESVRLQVLVSTANDIVGEVGETSTAV